MRRRPLLLILGLGLLTAGTSCRGNTDLLQAELRAKDRQLRELRADLARAESLNHAFAHALRARTESGACAAPIGAPPPVTEIELGRGTGPVEADGRPGECGLMVVVVPKDADGHEVKAPGTLCVTAMEILPGGVKQPLSTWDVPPERLRATWRGGFISTGYFVTLPWKEIPATEKLRVVARFTSLDGVMYEAERDVTLRRMPGPDRPPPPVVLPGPPTPLPMPKPALIEPHGPGLFPVP